MSYVTSYNLSFQISVHYRHDNIVLPVHGMKSKYYYYIKTIKLDRKVLLCDSHNNEWRWLQTFVGTRRQFVIDWYGCCDRRCWYFRSFRSVLHSQERCWHQSRCARSQRLYWKSVPNQSTYQTLNLTLKCLNLGNTGCRQRHTLVSLDTVFLLWAYDCGNN